MYSIKQGIAKSAKYFVLFALPVLVDRFVVSYPQYAQLTLGAILVGLVNLLKVKYSFSLSSLKK